MKTFLYKKNGRIFIHKEMIDDNPEEFRFLFLEDSSAGKSTIINRFLDNVFQEDLTPTSGMTLSQKIVRLDHEETIKKIMTFFEILKKIKMRLNLQLKKAQLMLLL